jgi:hypothetical protein
MILERPWGTMKPAKARENQAIEMHCPIHPSFEISFVSPFSLFLFLHPECPVP